MTVKLCSGNQIPTFHLKDIHEKEVHLELLNGKKTVLIFFRFVGCIICATSMLPFTNYLKNKKNVNVIYVYTSGKEKCQTATNEIPFPEHFHIISDPSKSFYSLFGVTYRSFFAFIKSMFNFMPKKSKIESALKSKDIYQDVSKLGSDGDMLINPADFLIDENGKIVTAHYGKHYADHISLKKLQSFIDEG
tara:strand:- start:1613 stop:2185 length:573 start_codon:yes stop_codon:yes gene_type:complete